MKNKLKYFISIILIVLISLILISRFSVVSMATTFNTKNTNYSYIAWNGKDGDVVQNFGFYNNADVYCAHYGSDDALNYNETRKITDYIEITGSTAKSSTKTVTDSKYAELAYILGGGNYTKGFLDFGSHGIRQWIFWYYLDYYSEINNELSLKTTISGGAKKYYNPNSYPIIKEAKNYASNIDNISADILNAPTSIAQNDKGSYTLNITFKGQINSITAQDDNGNKINSVNVYSDIECTQKISYNQIISGNAFYIKSSDYTNGIKNITVNVKAKQAGIHTRLVICKHDSAAIQLMTIVASENKIAEDSVTIELEKPSDFTNIVIKKKDNNTKENISDIKFTVYDEYTKKYVKQDGTESSSQVVLKTDTNGEIKINNIDISGNTNRKFKVTEVGSDNLLYSGETQELEANSALRGTVTYNFVNTKAYSLTINKKGYSNQENLNAKFWIMYNNGTEWERIKVKDGKIIYKGESDYSSTDASDDITLNNGTITFSGIKRGKYWLFETNTSSQDYILSDQQGYTDIDSNGTYWNDSSTGTKYSVVDCGQINVGNGQGNDNNSKNSSSKYAIKTFDITNATNSPVITVYNEARISLTIEKKDYDSNEGLDATFRLMYKNGNNWEWVKFKDGKIIYKDETAYSSATKDFKLSNGIISFNEIKKGKYWLYEFETALSEYDLSIQQGYRYIDENGSYWTENFTGTKYGVVDCGEINVGNGTGNDASKNSESYAIRSFAVSDATNEPKIIIRNTKTFTIEGYVWNEEAPVKFDENGGQNNIWDETEPKIKDVIVKLVKKNGEVIASTKTDENGKYEFKTIISYKDVSNYYIEFDYSNLQIDGKRYIPAAFNATDSSKLVENGSSALYNEVAVKDVDISGIVTTDKNGNYGLDYLCNSDKLYDSETNTLKGINLGLKEIPDTDFQVKESLAQVVICVNGYQQTYNVYMDEEDEEDEEAKITYDEENSTAIVVTAQSSRDTSKYVQKIYPSDIKYGAENEWEELEVYVKYRIDITNTTYARIKELYEEKGLMIQNLINEYDFTRLEFVGSGKDDNAKGEWAEVSIDGKKVIKAGQEVLNRIGSIPAYYSKNSSANTKTEYVTFKLTKEAKEEILNNPDGVDTKEWISGAKATGYHEYTRKDYGWIYKNITQEDNIHKTTSKIREDTAPYFTFKFGKERVITGKVFEDTAEKKENGEYIGDGKYDLRENVVSDVTVELLDKNMDNATRYDYNFDNKNYNETSDVVRSDSDGIYKIEGVIPGEYYLRFTYGNGDQKIRDLKGNEIKDVKLDEYKSTIVPESSARTALQTQNNETNDTNWIWYKTQEANCNVAVDDLEQRSRYNDENSDKKITSIQAKTAQMSVTIENAGEELEVEKEQDGRWGYKQYYSLPNMNFGIVKQPELKVNLYKVITNIKITNIQNNVIVDGNPTQTVLQGVKALGTTNNDGNTFVAVEADQSELYGANVEVTYKIGISDESDVIYYEFDNTHYGYYYMFGLHDSSYSNKVRAKYDELIDCLDPSVSYYQEISGATLYKKNGTGWQNADNGETHAKYERINEIVEEQKKTTKYEYKEILSVSDSGNSTDEKIIKVSKLLSSSDDDMEVINGVALLSLDKGTQPGDESKGAESLKLIKTPSKPESEYATLTITPPTGENQQIALIYSSIAVIALVILGVGIIIIKKKVLK